MSCVATVLRPRWFLFLLIWVPVPLVYGTHGLVNHDWLQLGFGVELACIVAFNVRRPTITLTDDGLWIKRNRFNQMFSSWAEVVGVERRQFGPFATHQLRLREPLRKYVTSDMKSPAKIVWKPTPNQRVRTPSWSDARCADSRRSVWRVPRRVSPATDARAPNRCGANEPVLRGPCKLRLLGGGWSGRWREGFLYRTDGTVYFRPRQPRPGPVLTLDGFALSGARDSGWAERWWFRDKTVLTAHALIGSVEMGFGSEPERALASTLLSRDR
jgi:hypothetical protein